MMSYNYIDNNFNQNESINSNFDLLIKYYFCNPINNNKNGKVIVKTSNSETKFMNRFFQ